MDKVLSNDKIDNVGALVLNDNKLTKVDLKDFSVSKKNIFADHIEDPTEVRRGNNYVFRQ